MSTNYNPALMVARFLKANQYNNTLAAFLVEAGLPEDAGNATKDDLTIEKVLQEKSIFDITLGLEKVGEDGAVRGWSDNAPKRFTQIPLSQPANLLCVSVGTYGGLREKKHVLAATNAARTICVLNLDNNFTPLNSRSSFASESPMLDVQVLPYPFMMATIMTSMSGKVMTYNQETGTLLSERSDHTKYVPRLAIGDPRNPFTKVQVATAGWDGKIFYYRLPSPSMSEEPKLGKPIAELSLPTNPEAILLTRHPETDDYILIVTRRDSTRLYFYRVPDQCDEGGLTLLGSQNLAPHSNAWIAFSPSSIALCPTDPTLLAVATSSLPHMKLMIVRLLFPPAPAPRSPSPSATTNILLGSETTVRSTETSTPIPAVQPREELEIQNKEEAAILINVSTLAPQTPYSTPQVVWRPDGTGVWVNGDDGIIRGVEAKSGKIVETLKDGHEVGSKIRTLWAGKVSRGVEEKAEGHGTEEEVLISGGFDHRLVLWSGDGEQDQASEAERI